MKPSNKHHPRAKNKKIMMYKITASWTPTQLYHFSMFYLLIYSLCASFFFSRCFVSFVWHRALVYHCIVVAAFFPYSLLTRHSFAYTLFIVHFGFRSTSHSIVEILFFHFVLFLFEQTYWDTKLSITNERRDKEWWWMESCSALFLLQLIFHL